MNVSQTLPEHHMSSGDPQARTKAAIDDLVNGLLAWRFWTTIGWYDIKQRYRRTRLGPFWITISMGILTSVLGLIYGSILGVPLGSYLLYLAAGIVTWYFVSSTILEGTTVFIGAEGIIKQSAIPLSFYVYRAVWRNFIVLLHNVVVLAVVFLALRSVSSLNPFTIALGLFLLVTNLLIWTLVLGMLSTRFRDLPPTMTNLMQVMFYITPILYEPDQLPAKLRLIAHYNPLYHVIEVFRRPLLGETSALESYAVATTTLVVGGLAAFALFRRFRGRIAYWL